MHFFYYAIVYGSNKTNKYNLKSTNKHNNNTL